MILVPISKDARSKSDTAAMVGGAGTAIGGFAGAKKLGTRAAREERWANVSRKHANSSASLGHPKSAHRARMTAVTSSRNAVRLAGQAKNLKRAGIAGAGIAALGAGSAIQRKVSKALIEPSAPSFLDMPGVSAPLDSHLSKALTRDDNKNIALGAAGGALLGPVGSGAASGALAPAGYRTRHAARGAVLGALPGPSGLVGGGYSAYRAGRNQTLTGKPRKKLEPVAKVGEWKSIDQRERSQSRNRKGIRNSNAVAGLGGAVAGTALSTTAGQRQAKNMVNGVKNSAKARALRPVSRAAAANPRGAVAVGGATLAAGALGVGGGLRARNAQHQSKINARRKAYHAKVNQS